MHVHFPANLRTGKHQLSCIRRENFANFTDGPFHEQAGALLFFHGGARNTREALFILLKESEGVMHNLAAVRIRGFHLDRLDPARLGKPGFDDRPEPLVLGFSSERVGVGSNDWAGGVGSRNPFKHRFDALGPFPRHVSWVTAIIDGPRRGPGIPDFFRDAGIPLGPFDSLVPLTLEPMHASHPSAGPALRGANSVLPRNLDGFEQARLGLRKLAHPDVGYAANANREGLLESTVRIVKNLDGWFGVLGRPAKVARELVDSAEQLVGDADRFQIINFIAHGDHGFQFRKRPRW